MGNPFAAEVNCVPVGPEPQSQQLGRLRRGALWE
jgi:hypothetical protein